MDQIGSISFGDDEQIGSVPFADDECDEYVKRFFEENEKHADSDKMIAEDIVNENDDTEEQNVSLVSVVSKQNSIESQKELNEPVMEPKRKRRSNLGEFSETQSIKRKNEAAKRELTSIVTQLGKIDKQLNSDKHEPRVSLNFNAKFTSFKSNRLSTFNYPPGGQVKQTLLDFDTTVSAIKNAMKEAVVDLMVPLKSNIDNPVTSDVTPTKKSAGIQAFPSPVTATGRRLLSRSLCSKNTCTFGKKLKNPAWMKCNYRYEEGHECNYLVHAACIGFPTLNYEDVKELDCWYCPDHAEMAMKRIK